MELQRVKRSFLLISLTLIITFTLIINVTFTRAEEIAGINPDLGFGYAVLLGGESVTLSTTTSAPFDVYIAGVVSIGSPTISATVTGITSTARGWWWVVLTGNAPENWYDFSFGFSFGVAPDPGKSTTININSILCIGFVMGGLILDPTTVSAESPVNYSIKIN